jgi:hypothetical protein
VVEHNLFRACSVIFDATVSFGRACFTQGAANKHSLCWLKRTHEFSDKEKHEKQRHVFSLAIGDGSLHKSFASDPFA